MGRAERMDRFIEQIEKHYKSPSVAVCASDIDLCALPTLPLSSRSLFPDRPCVYVAIDYDGVVQYIGKSVNPKSRWASHHKYDDLISKKDVEVAYIFLDEQFLDDAEKEMIALYRPPMNVHHLGKSRNPEYKQLGLYIRKEVHRKAKAKAIDDELELSDVVEKLLCEWLENPRMGA